MRSVLLLLGMLAACETAAAPFEASAVDAAIYRAAQDPEGAAAWGRAQQALAIGNYKAALPDLRVAVTKCPDLVRAHLALQDAALALGGEDERAMRAFYAALSPGRTPVNAYVKARLYDTSFARGRALEDILKSDSSFGWAHLSYARVRRAQGQLLVAVDSFRAAIGRDDSLVEAHLERGEILAELGRYEEAAADYEAYFRARPEDWASLREYAAMLVYRTGRMDRALELLDRLDRQFPRDVELRMHRGAAYWRARRPREALAQYLAVLEDDPGNARAMLDVGLIYYDAMPLDDSTAERAKYWPRARAAFRMFLARGRSGDGHEEFERVLGVPYRLDVIEAVLGPEDGEPVSLDDVRLPADEAGAGSS